MPHRWVAIDNGHAGAPTVEPAADAALHCDFDALPFPNQSLDLIVPRMPSSCRAIRT